MKKLLETTLKVEGNGLYLVYLSHESVSAGLACHRRVDVVGEFLPSSCPG